MNTIETVQPIVGLVAITKHGTRQMLIVANSLPDAHINVSTKFSHAVAEASNVVNIISGPVRPQIGGLMRNFDQLVFFVSLGAVVRLIAPHLKSKEEDPGVLVVDDRGQFVIPVLAGHVGGANMYAEQLAATLDATAILTTASDAGKTISVDILGRELGWQVEAPKINITRVSAHMVNEEPIALVQECGSLDWWSRPTPIPKNVTLFKHFNDVDMNKYKAILWITEETIDPGIWLQLKERLVVYRPPAGQS